MRFHVIGIGGAGMSALARLLLVHGEVSGSDRGRWPLSEALRPLGVTVHDTFAPEHLGSADVAIASSAYGAENVEIGAALDRGLPLWKRQDAWRFLAAGRRVVAVAGTHGKTTTTGLTWTVLAGGGIDASLISGAAVAGTGSNAHVGTSDVLVIEADEYDFAFHALEPAVAVVTNVDHDHVDVFPTAGEYADAFRTFIRGIAPGGTLVACADDPGAAALAAEARSAASDHRVMTYGMGAADLRVSAVDADDRAAGAAGGERTVTYEHRGQRARSGLRLLGKHNALNAAAAVGAGLALGVSLGRAAEGAARFAGTSRRLEELGTAGGVTVVDDYAHHPAELRASIEAVRGRGERVIVVFQPHTPSRLAAFFADFGAALREADASVVAETFVSARERPDARAWARELAALAGGVYASGPDEAAHAAAALARPGDLVLVLGAGDIRVAAERLLGLLRERAGP